MGKISDLAVSYLGPTNESLKYAFCVGYAHALKNVTVELSNAQEKDIPKLMQTWYNDAQELLQELREVRASRAN